jgi:hypothetical protein
MIDWYGTDQCQIDSHSVRVASRSEKRLLQRQRLCLRQAIANANANKPNLNLSIVNQHWDLCDEKQKAIK